MTTEPNNAAIEFIESWRQKAFAIPDGRTSAIITRSFDALKSINGSDMNDLAFRKEEMKTARENAFKFDNTIATNPDRRFFFGLNQSIEATCETILARARAEDAEQKRAAQQAMQQAQYEAQAKAQAKARAEAQKHANAARTPAASSSGPLFAEVKKEEVDEGAIMIKEEELDLEMDADAYGNQQFDQFYVNGFGSSRNDCINISDDGDEANYTLSAKKRRGLSVKTISCPRCTATNMNISGFVKHLTDLHKTTPVKENVAFQCGCSFIGTNYTEVRKHALQCFNPITIVPRPPAT